MGSGNGKKYNLDNLAYTNLLLNYASLLTLSLLAVRSVCVVNGHFAYRRYLIGTLAGRRPEALQRATNFDFSNVSITSPTRLQFCMCTTLGPGCCETIENSHGLQRWCIIIEFIIEFTVSAASDPVFHFVGGYASAKEGCRTIPVEMVSGDGWPSANSPNDLHFHV